MLAETCLRSRRQQTTYPSENQRDLEGASHFASASRALEADAEKIRLANLYSAGAVARA